MKVFHIKLKLHRDSGIYHDQVYLVKNGPGVEEEVAQMFRWAMLLEGEFWWPRLRSYISVQEIVDEMLKDKTAYLIVCPTTPGHYTFNRRVMSVGRERTSPAMAKLYHHSGFSNMLTFEQYRDTIRYISNGTITRLCTLCPRVMLTMTGMTCTDFECRQEFAFRKTAEEKEYYGKTKRKSPGGRAVRRLPKNNKP